ncbi:MAG: aspartyl protease family protein [Sphingomonas sp.]|uniref:aspartyl protease family protein n=1 Tax=Sphingomonas sp. TaxID=28214 RepID=UPI0025D8D70F|nr:aspartyl protease family protein [Sphingomonas sp.]MBX3563438.1 aspartyl protease family protein [Sphingomonas sp.]
MLAMLALAAATQEPVLAADSEARWVPFELTASNQIRFTIQAGGRDVSAILDTGISISVVSRGFADTLGLKHLESGRATAIGGAIPIDLAAAPRVAFGGLSRTGGRVAVADMAGIPGVSAEIYVGADLLGCCAIDIDYPARRFRILPSGRMPFTGDTAPLSKVRGSGVFVTEFTLGTRRLRPILVDTGDGSSLTLTSQAWTTARPPGTRVTTTLGYGAGGALVSDAAILPGIMLGGRATGETELRIEAAGGFSQMAGTAGRIGTGLLMRYRVLLDPGAGRMVLRPDPAAERTPLRSTSGLLVNYANGALRILHVMRGSPAEQAGFAAGERICAADGQPVREDVEADGKVDWTVGTPGRVVRLRECDGRERTITLRAFY